AYLLTVNCDVNAYFATIFLMCAFNLLALCKMSGCLASTFSPSERLTVASSRNRFSVSLKNALYSVLTAARIWSPLYGDSTLCLGSSTARAAAHFLPLRFDS